MRILKAVMIIFVIIGIGFLAYPTASAFIADYTSTKVMIDYDKQMKNLEKFEIQQRKQKAEEFNTDLSDISITAFKKSSKEKTKEIKNEFKSGEMLGYIIIDKIDVNLPIPYKNEKELKEKITTEKYTLKRKLNMKKINSNNNNYCKYFSINVFQKSLKF